MPCCQDCAIGCSITCDNVSDGGASGGAHCALKSWHAEWLGRQHHALLAVMKMYCHTITTSHLTPELQAHMLLEGALAAAAERQRLSSAVRESELGVVLDTSSVEEGAWLGSLMQTSPTARCAQFAVFSYCIHNCVSCAVHARACAGLSLS